ncbi:sensor histidine kinase [Clostridium taeniosporum]|uniref:GHKL domain-containing protein n=1 Tax=Clostridium taeniosporum TaxID=394958 RepID=A0A1D7XNY6_9CLOT|nr:GHKL domain-containing protein [Clostridium taeniosporum]AOR25024.1 GHKL domain-containing protein [Clostridium taeniosporum]
MNIKVITSFISILTFVLVTYNLKIIEFKKKNFLKNLAIVYLVAGIGCLNFEMISIPLFLITMMILLFLEDKQIIKNFISIFFSIIIFILSDIIQGTFFIKVLNQDIDKILSNKITLISMHLVLFFIAFLISSLVAYILKKLKFDLEIVNFKNKFAVVLFTHIVLTCLIFYISAMMMKFSHIDNLIVCLDSILFLSYFISTIIITYVFYTDLKKEMEFKNKKIEFQKLQEYTSTLESMYNDMRKFRHDYINILSSMTGYIEQKDLEGLDKFFNTKILLLNDNISRKNFKLDKLQNIKIIELKGLLSSKVIRAQELGIDVFIDIMEFIEFINMDIIDLCRSMGILLDNAIEAAVLCKAPSLKLGIINNQNSIIILIINSCLKENPPIYKMFEKGFSTKGINRGLGLSNLREIVSNYKNISFDTSIKNQEFIQNLQILNS